MNMLISILNNLIVHYMSGTSGMLPSQFNYQPKSITKRVHQAEKPVELLEEIIGYISVSYTHLDVYKRQVQYLISEKT